MTELSQLPGSETELGYLSVNPTAILSQGCSQDDCLSLFIFHVGSEGGFVGQEMQQNAGAWELEVGPVCLGVVRVMGYRQGNDSLCYIALSPWLCSGVSGLGWKFWVQH